MRNFSINLSKALAWIPILSLLFLHPSQLGKVFAVDGKVFAFLLLFIFIAILWLRKVKINAKVDIFQAILLFQILYFFWFSLQNVQPSYIFTAITLLLVFLYYTVVGYNDALLFKSAKLYVNIMSLIALGASISFLGFYSGLIPQVYFTTTDTGRELFLIGPSFTTELLTRDGIVRPGGIFTEPGQLSLHILFGLMLNFFTVKNKWAEIFMIFGVITTLSLGGYMGLLIYIFFLKLRVTWKQVFIFSFALLTILAIAYVIIINFVEEYMINYAIDRVSTLESGGNRGYGYNVFFENARYVGFFGTEKFFIDRFGDYDIDATFFGPFLQYGWVGGTVIMSHVVFFIVYSFFKPVVKNIRYSLGVGLMIAFFLYHRPFVLMYSFYILLLFVNKCLRRHESLRVMGVKPEPTFSPVVTS